MNKCFKFQVERVNGSQVIRKRNGGKKKINNVQTHKGILSKCLNDASHVLLVFEFLNHSVPMQQKYLMQCDTDEIFFYCLG